MFDVRMMPQIVALLLLGEAVGPRSGLAQDRPGSFRVGDRVWLRVEGEAQLSDTFTVGPTLALSLPMVGEISLAGVPRSSIEAHLKRELERFLRDPVVRARALIRIAIAGEVARPGFYAVPSDLVLADAVMVAGGATPASRLERLRIERGNGLLWPKSAVQQAIAAGQTLDDLDLQAGDRIVVPRRRAEMTPLLGILAPALAYGLVTLVTR